MQQIHAPNNGRLSWLHSESDISEGNNVRIDLSLDYLVKAGFWQSGSTIWAGSVISAPPTTRTHEQQRTTEEVIERIADVPPLLFSSLASWLLWAHGKICRFCRNRLSDRGTHGN